MPVHEPADDYAVLWKDGRKEVFRSREQANEALAQDAGKGKIRAIGIPGYDRFFPKVLLNAPQSGDDERSRRALLGDVKQGLLYCVFIGVLLFANIPGLQLTAGTRMLAILLLFLFGIAPAINSGFQWMELARKRTPEQRERRRADEILFSYWITGFPRWPVLLAVGLLVAMFLVQALHKGIVTGPGVYFSALGDAYRQAGFGGLFRMAFFLYSDSLGDSYREAGLLRSSVRMGGEWWRIITAGLLHGGIIHLYFNSRALLSIASVLLGVCRMSWVVIVFTLSVMGGSLASIYGAVRLAPSVGASGGIMGLLGFLLVLAYFYKGGLPHFIKSAVVCSVFLIGILGWLGKDFIDNAAHAGGLATGVVLGLVVARFSDLLPGRRGTPAYIYPVAGISGAVLLFGVVRIMSTLFSA